MAVSVAIAFWTTALLLVATSFALSCDHAGLGWLAAKCDSKTGEQRWECNLCSDSFGFPKCPPLASSVAGVMRHAARDGLADCGGGRGRKCTYTTNCDNFNGYAEVRAIDPANIVLAHQGYLFSKDFPPVAKRGGLPRDQPDRSASYYDYRVMTPASFQRAASGLHDAFRPNTKYLFLVKGNDVFHIHLFNVVGNEFPLPGHSSLMTLREYQQTKTGGLVVLYAGEFWTSPHGVITRWSNGSGHFKPRAEDFSASFGKFWGFPAGTGAFKDASQVKTTGAAARPAADYSKYLAMKTKLPKQAIINRMTLDGVPKDVISHYDKTETFPARSDDDADVMAVDGFEFYQQEKELLEEEIRDIQRLQAAKRKRNSN